MASLAIPAGTPLQQPFMAAEPIVPVLVLGSQEKERAQDEELIMLVNRLDKLAQEQVTAKLGVETRMLEAVRAYHGYYDSTTEKNLTQAGQSRAFVKITRAKTVTLEARMFDFIFPTDDRNWSVAATPVPKLTKEGREATLRARNAAQQANEAEASGRPEIAMKIVAEGQDEAGRAKAANDAIAVAREKSIAMQKEMDDQLTECQYPVQCRDMIHDACLLGTGILKGPVTGHDPRGRWLPDDGGSYALEPREDPRPKVIRVDPWAFFPDMSARHISEAEFTFERYLWTKKDLRAMVKTHGFFPDAVRMLLDERKTRVPAINYLTQLRSITGEATVNLSGRYVGWEYHGPLECEEICTVLRWMGRHEEAAAYEDDEDPLVELRVVLYFCEGQILKIAPDYPLDSGETLYSIFNIEESEGSIFGYGIPTIMQDSQIAVNSAWRMGLDNSALSVGPQAIIDKDSVIPADGSWTMLPKKIWHRTKAAVPNGPPPIEFFNVPNNMDEISAIIKIALEFIDMETGIPLPQQGEQGSHTTQTVGGMTILQNAANIIFRRMVKNYDDGIIAPTMRRLYDWNMQHSPRDDIKGDMSVDARGTSVLLLKEVQAQNILFVVQNLMAAPTVQPMLKPYQMVEKLFQTMMIPTGDVMVTEDDYKENMKKLAEQPPAPDPAQIQAEARIQSAQIQAQASQTRGEVSLMIAQNKERIAVMEMMQQGEINLEEMRNELRKLDMKHQSDERKLAVEVAVEERMAKDARKHGDEPSGSGGSFSAGGKK